MVRFDAYTLTTQAAKADQLLPLLYFFGDQVTEGRGFHTFGSRASVRDADGDEVGYVQWGGKQEDRVMLEVKGTRTPAVVEAVRASYPHRCTRVDSCADFDAPGAFDRVLGAVMDAKKDHRLYGESRGDWDDFPELGRTQYLGAATSPVKLRLYEKGKQPEYRHLDRSDWCRLEIQVRPQKEAKQAYAGLSALEVWGASKWTRQLAALVLAEHVDPHPPGTVWKVSERDKKLQWMLKQYGAALVSLADDCGGWDVAGLTLREMFQAMKGRGDAS
jgi:DNA relaxase NicK